MVNGGFTWADVRDVAAGAIAAARQGRPGETYLLGGHWLSIPDLARLAEQETGVRPPLITTPMWLARLVAPLALLAARAAGSRPLITPESMNALCFNRHLACGKAERELGYGTRPLDESVRDVYGWFADHGKLEK